MEELSEPPFGCTSRGLAYALDIEKADIDEE